MTEEQLALRPSPDRWPLWATIGHTACQRVFWLCDFAGEPGAETTRFTNAGYDCPGDDDLEHVLDADALAEALDSTFRIVEHCLDSMDARHARRGDPSRPRDESRARPRSWVGHPARLRPRRLPHHRAGTRPSGTPALRRSTFGVEAWRRINLLASAHELGRGVRAPLRRVVGEHDRGRPVLRRSLRARPTDRSSSSRSGTAGSRSRSRRRPVGR